MLCSREQLALDAEIQNHANSADYLHQIIGAQQRQIRKLNKELEHANKELEKLRRIVDGRL